MKEYATGEHLGEWERGESYRILSRDTSANNQHLVDELIDVSLYRGGAPVLPHPRSSQELVRAVDRLKDAGKAWPSWVRIHRDQNDTNELEDCPGERAADPEAATVR